MKKNADNLFGYIFASNRVHGIEHAIGSENHPRHQLSDIKKEKIFSGMNDFLIIKKKLKRKIKFNKCRERALFSL